MSRPRFAAFLATSLFAVPAAADSDVEVRTQRAFHVRHLALVTTTTEALMGVAPGVTHDGFGLTANGATAIENRWELDGVDITGVMFGGPAFAIPIDFAEEISITTAGHTAASAGAPGAVFAVETLRGGDRVTGSAFAYLGGGALTAGRTDDEPRAASIDARREEALALDLGLEVGGPIVADKAWFWVGVAPRLARTTVTRVTQRQTDPDQDGFSNGYEELDRVEHTESNDRISTITRVDVAPAAGHQGSVTLAVVPGRGAGARMDGWVDQQAWETSALTHALSLRWSSRFGERTEVRAQASEVRTARTFGSPGGARDDLRLQTLYGAGLDTWAQLGGESMDTARGCTDDATGDDYPLIVNCPDTGAGYRIGGLGNVQDDHERRRVAGASVVHRVDAIGTHALEAGGELERLSFDQIAGWTGGSIVNTRPTSVSVLSVVRLRPADVAPGAGFPDSCVDLTTSRSYACEVLDQGDHARGAATRRTLYARDLWQPRRWLTIDAGVRYERQALQYGEHLRGHVDPVTADALGDDALVFDGLWAPRLGVVVDPTAEGRSRVFAGWARVHEAIPLELAARLFDGEHAQSRQVDATQCPPLLPGIPDGAACDDAGFGTISTGVLPIDPAARAPYVDQLHLGVEYAIADDTALGAGYRHVRLRRALEDAWNGETIVLTNPGEAPGTDRASRDHQAIELTVRHDLSRRMFVLASYTWSRTRGTYTGLIGYDNGQVAPHTTSQFDLPGRMANRDGATPQDRAHSLKLDGYRSFPLTRDDTFTLGVRGRLMSGTPVDVLGPDAFYGDAEVFLLPRGAGGRTPMVRSLDLHLEYERSLGGGMAVSVFVDLLDVTNSQGVAEVDDRYARSSATAPIVGGRYEDLIWAKEALDSGDSSTPITRNPGHGQPTSRYNPFTARLGARLVF